MLRLTSIGICAESLGLIGLNGRSGGAELVGRVGTTPAVKKNIISKHHLLNYALLFALLFCFSIFDFILFFFFFWFHYFRCWREFVVILFLAA